MQKAIKMQDGYINPMTGEYFSPEEVVYIQTEEQRDAARLRFKQSMAARTFRESPEVSSHGPFVWSVYATTTKLYPDISSATLTRLIFLATYVWYDGKLHKSIAKMMRKEDAEIEMRLPKETFRRFWNEVVDLGILAEDEDGTILMNKKYFQKGRLDIPNQVMAATRIYIRGVRELYWASTPKSHKKLSILFQIVPFVSREFNVICWNPQETDQTLLKPMSLAELCEAIGYDATNASRIGKMLLDPKFTTKDSDKEQSVVRFVTGDCKRYEIFIHPEIYYAGHQWENVKILGCFN